jgi:AcrR family transcriptional regulator
MASNTRDRLVECGVRRFYNEGFRNVGIDQILSDVGISKTAFYNHFESKDDLMLAVLGYQQAWLESTLLKMLRDHAGRTAIDQLRGLFDVVQMVIESEGFHGCIFVNAAMEFPLPHDPAHELAKQSKLAIEQMVFDIAERAGAKDPQALAEELCMVIEGCYVTRTVMNDPGTIDIARRLADMAIARHLGAS